MFHLKRDTAIPSVDSTVEILQKHVDKCGVPLDYDRMQEYYAYYTLAGHNLISKIVTYTAAGVSADEYDDGHFVNLLKKANAAQYFAKTTKGQ